MFKFLKRWFGKKTNTKEIKKNILCGITIEVNNDGTINILCSWPNFDKNNADTLDAVSTEFGTLLYFLNKGFLSKDIINTLTNLTNDSNKYDILFVDMSLAKWTDYLDSNLDLPHDMEPMIRPSSVFNNR